MKLTTICDPSSLSLKKVTIEFKKLQTVSPLLGLKVCNYYTFFIRFSILLIEK